MKSGRFTCLLIATLLGAGPAFAKAPEFPALAAGFKAGMEVELMPEHFAKLMPFFDFASLQANPSLRNKFSEPDHAFYDSYLRDNPRALNSLPEDVRAKLTEGLTLESLVKKEEAPKLEVPAQKLEVKKPTFQLLQPNEPITNSRPALILPDKKPEAVQAESFRTTDGLLRPKRADWETLHERWRKLPLQEKADLVDWELLSPQAKATIAYEVEGRSVNLEKPRLTLKSNAPALLKKLHWGRDGDALEFKHLVPVENAAELYDDIVAFGRLAGVSSKLENAPESRLTGVSLHYHLSLPNSDLGPLTSQLNDLTLLRRVDQGIISDLTGEGNFTFTELTKSRGLVRSVAKDHIEIRSHPTRLKEELEFVLKALALPEKESVALVEQEIDKLLKKKSVIDLIQKYRPELLAKWKSKLPGNLVRRASDADANVLSRIHDEDPAVVKAAIRQMRPLKEMSPGSQRAAIALWSREALATPEGMDIAATLWRKISVGQVWPEPVWENVLNLIPALNEETAAEVAANIAHRDWPQAHEQKLFELLRRPDLSPAVQKALLRELMQADFNPHLVGRALNADLPAPYRSVFADQALRTLPSDIWTPANWSAAPMILRGLPDADLAVFLKDLNKNGMRAKVYEEIVSLTKRTDLSGASQFELKKLLKKLPYDAAQKALAAGGIANEYAEILRAKRPGILQSCGAFFSRVFSK